jgi:hypothetical protein
MRAKGERMIPKTRSPSPAASRAQPKLRAFVETLRALADRPIK